MPLSILVTILLLCIGLTQLLLTPLVWGYSLHLPNWFAVGVLLILLTWLLRD